MLLLAAWMIVCIAGSSSLGADAQSATELCVIDVTTSDARYSTEPLIINNAALATSNSERMARIMATAPPAAVLHFPAGNYYFSGSAVANHASIESSQPGQIFSGDGTGVTNIIQTNTRRDFGFESDPQKKRVPTATIRVRHKGCSVRNLSVLVDPAAPLNTIAGSAAIQVAHIKYFPDNNIGIIETTGVGGDFLLDYVMISAVDVGRNIAAGIQGTQFFEYGIDIIGSGGHVRVRGVNRLDARTGVRLDNGNHTGQGDYVFENIAMIGKHGVTNGGVFFDWIGGQAPMIRNCAATFTSGLHAGPLGVDGDRLEPNQEAEVHRREAKEWDWLTLHGHTFVDEPSDAQRTEWYGLPRHAIITRIGSEPRTGGKDWREGSDYTLETISTSGTLQHATRIHWPNGGPAPGSNYYVTFHQPKEYRVQDLQWGTITGCSLQEALQMTTTSYALKIEDQEYGYLNPDFDFRPGYGFNVDNNFILNGPILLEGSADYVTLRDNTAGVCDLRMQGASDARRISRITISGNRFNSAVLGDYMSHIALQQNMMFGNVTLQAPNLGEWISITGNDLTATGTSRIDLAGRNLRHIRVQDNDISNPDGTGIEIEGAKVAIITGNDTTDCAKGLILKDSTRAETKD